MKKLILSAAVAFMGVSAFAQESTALPQTSLKDFKGQNVSFNEVVESGKVTIISFWATWCIPCKKEISSITGKLKDWQTETPDLNFMTISEDDPRAMAQVVSYAKSKGWNFPAYLDPNNDLKRSLNFQNVPFTMIVDKKGQVAYMHSGYDAGGEDDVYAKAKEIAAK